MKLFIFKQEQFIPGKPERIWNFFTDPANLKTITPPYMGFDIKSGADERMFEGQVISYTVRPFPGIPLNWITEITHVEAGVYFIDEQRFGPYRFWHHRHRFEKAKGGVLMTDTVHYGLPVPIFQNLINDLIVRPRLEEIFSYRRKKIEELFP
jgi:ligand-binding SRPBCC domain-containing protein